ncbi:NAD-dependent epimerase/dehydratase family protein [Zunongwangia sp. HGR-M22]|uniref:NAD-dependent epimerase/dehydratase family protein n=1 Tax=Zunongwangia sp. HGR-M22 TaxID=3015168 RepID=UPI0022DD124D|nr:NAD-dependent epimerase/dehydratase family protein [Zunongwangia sp. HGR-M22]WBL24309.1 NAD-dependent epimerase/dehydratase family protein [Zunongwangia sp. HGR-M22]
MNTNKKILLTGITGFVGMQTAIQLLEKGYQVTGTLRDAKKIPATQEVIARHTSNIENLHFAEADLNDENIWKDLMRGMDYVQHIASPFPKTIPKNEDDLILPARKGTLSIVSAAAQNNVKRIVSTNLKKNTRLNKRRVWNLIFA